MQLPQDYAERVYAGVLGKIIGVYLGRPFEGWEFARIERELGEITDYVHERLGVPLIVTDDDISGTFTFIRALEDFAGGADLSAADIGRTWLNYLIEERTVLWWGGLGNSTEHTAYLRLKNGIEAPRSGSIALNTKVVAEQIGAQIFIDGWAMVAPGDPELAAALAAKAGSVSHDGEAVYGAQVLAAMEAAAFTESNIDTLLDTGVRFIPADSVIARLIADIRAWHAADGDDWRTGFGRVQGSYGYDRYGGNCHMVPNHAIIILALLYGGGDFAHSLMIANTCGWDTDCNSGNVGCLLGIRGGLQAIDAAPANGDGTGVGKWRGPVADRLYLPTADGGRCITDAVQQSYRLINLGRGLHGTPGSAGSPSRGRATWGARSFLVARFRAGLRAGWRGDIRGQRRRPAGRGVRGRRCDARRRHVDRHLHSPGRRQGGRLPALGLADPALGAAHPRAGRPGRSGNRRRGVPAVGEGGALRG